MSIAGLFQLLAVALAAAKPEDKEKVTGAFQAGPLNGHGCKSFACRKDPSGYCRCYCRRCKAARSRAGAP